MDDIKSMVKKAVYPGTFDPPTNGHFDIALRASLIFDELVIAVTDNDTKNVLFTAQERLEMLRAIFEKRKNITCKIFKGLLVDFVAEEGAKAVIRGLRAISDFEYELQLASLNNHLNKSVETIFFMASDENLFVSSSMVKEIAKLGGDISQKVHPYVWKRLKGKFGHSLNIK
jgi:pantetheine-phosphate adenylyltransferase